MSLSDFSKILFVLQICVVSSSAQALIVYGKGNSDAQVDYGTANAAQASVVSTSSDCSAVYIGNGWFLTANHVSVAVNNAISQNGNSALVSKVDTSLNAKFGADLKLFRVADTSALADLQAAKLSKDIYSKMKDTSWDGGTLNRGSEILLVGAGLGRSEDSALDATTVSSDDNRGTVRYGNATILNKAACEIWNGNTGEYEATKYPVIDIVAEAREGAAGALTGDSGSGMFFEYGGDFYLVGTTAWVDSDASARTITFGQIEADMEYRTKYSHTYAINLENFLDEIGRITGVSIPEPADCAALMGGFVLIFAAFCMRNKNG